MFALLLQSIDPMADLQCLDLTTAVRLEDIFVPIGILLLLFLAYKALSRKRFIENLAPSTCAGLTVGMCRLEARATDADSSSLLKTPHSGSRSVYWSVRVEDQVEVIEEELKSRGRGRQRRRLEWRVVEHRSSRTPFWMEDETGRVEVDPQGAQVEASVVYREIARRGDRRFRKISRRRPTKGSTGLRRVEVRAIEPGTSLFAVGPARLTPEGDRLRLGPGGWRDPLYLISSRGPVAVPTGYGRWSLLLFTIAMLLSWWWFGALGVAGGLLPVASSVAAPIRTPWHILPIALTVSSAALLYLKIMIDGFVELRHRVARAWSMLEVELARRHRLISELVGVVSGYAEHEAEVLRALVRVRAGATSEAPGVSVQSLGEVLEAQASAVTRLMALSEAYPTLGASAVFEALMSELTATEDRVAWARGFYNDSVERLNTRVERVPDCFVAWWFGVRPARYLGQRGAVDVECG